jgi:hypothetical protein
MTWEPTNEEGGNAYQRRLLPMERAALSWLPHGTRSPKGGREETPRRPIPSRGGVFHLRLDAARAASLCTVPSNNDAAV